MCYSYTWHMPIFLVSFQLDRVGILELKDTLQIIWVSVSQSKSSDCYFSKCSMHKWFYKEIHWEVLYTISDFQSLTIMHISILNALKIPTAKKLFTFCLTTLQANKNQVSQTFVSQTRSTFLHHFPQLSCPLVWNCIQENSTFSRATDHMSVSHTITCFCR